MRMGTASLTGGSFPTSSGRENASAAPADGLGLEFRKTALPGVASSQVPVLR
jgi:hypothetical protein